MRTKISIAGLLLVLIVFNVLIAQKERSLTTGKAVYLELAPVDPRSLMQGDYMVLRYALAAQLEHVYDGDGLHSAYLTVGADDVATAVSDKPSPDALLIKVRSLHGAVSFGAESYFFQEGHGHLYEKAKYGQLQVDSSGSVILTGLCDEQRRLIKP